MKKILILLLTVITTTTFAQSYKITPSKIVSWTSYTCSGILWGAREAFHADATVFERKFNVSEYSFFGSKQWERNYVNNRYRAADGRINPHKPEILGNFGRDYWHTSSWVAGTFVIGSTFTIGCSKQKTKHKLIDLAIGIGLATASANLTYKYLRQ